MSESSALMPTLDRDQILRMAQIMCTEDQIAAYFNVGVEVIQAYYMEDVQKGWEKGRIFLRQLQFNKAREGDQDMLEFLGRQYLGQV